MRRSKNLPRKAGHMSSVWLLEEECDSSITGIDDLEFDASVPANKGSKY